MEGQNMDLMINYNKVKYMETGKPKKESYIRKNSRDIES